jgi:hypothetical protein
MPDLRPNLYAPECLFALARAAGEGKGEGSA